MDWLSHYHCLLDCNRIRDLVVLVFTIVVKSRKVEDDMSVETPSVNIGTRRVKQSRGKQSALVKVIWNKDTDGAIWELEEKFKEQYPELFTDP